MILTKSPMSKLLDKFAVLLSSDRFWINVLIGVMTWLQTEDWKIGAITALGLITGTGTVDRVSEKLGPRKP